MRNTSGKLKNSNRENSDINSILEGNGVASIGGRPWSNHPPQRHPLACWIFDNVLHAGSALHIGAYGQIRIVSTSTYGGVIRVCAVMRIQTRSTCSPKGGPAAARDKTFRLRSRAIGILINPPPPRLHGRCSSRYLFCSARRNLLFQGSSYVAVETRRV